MNRPLDMGMEFMFPGMGMQMGPSVAAIMPAPGSMPGMGGFQTAPSMGMGGMQMGGMNMSGFGTGQGF